MAAPTCPDLAFAGSVTTLAALTLTLGLDALYTSLTSITTDAGATVPVASRPQVTKGGAPTDYIVLEPAVTSPVAGKWVIIVCGASGAQPNAAAMLAPDTSALAQLYIGIWMANSGQTVSRADLATWTAAAPFVGTGTFSGFVKIYAALTTIASMTAYLSAEDIVFGVETSTGTQYMAEAGFGIRGVSDAALDSESGMLGRVFSLSTSGATPISTAWQTANIGAGSTFAPISYGTINGYSHCFYRVPGATSSHMRQCTWNSPASQSNGFPSSAAAEFIAASGAIEPEVIPFRDVVGSGTRDGTKVGRSRVFFFGPRKRTRYVLSTGGVAKWIACGSASSTSDANDAVLLPM